MSNVTETGGLVPDLAKIEGDEIVIRVPLAAIPYAASLALSEAHINTDDNGDTRVAITDPAVFAADMVRALNREKHEDGSTAIHLLLDEAVLEAFENGSEGASDDGADLQKAEG